MRGVESPVVGGQHDGDHVRPGLPCPPVRCARRRRRGRGVMALAKAWWARPGGRVALLTGALSVASAGIALSYLRNGVSGTALPGGGWWLAVLGLLFALTEGFTVYIRVRRGAHGI